MPPGLNASRKVAGGRSELIHGDEIAATATTTRGMKNMKRAKRVSAGALGVDCSSTEDLSSHLEPAGPKSKKRFVGVRQRPSGRWVAEIKDTTQKIRLWLGTFDSAEEGAKAYDSAARALRGANTRTNFVPAIASSCETTTKAARLIRLRQTAAAASTKPCAKLTELGLDQPDLKGNAEPVHSQETKVPENNQPLITSETRSNAINNHSLAEDHSRDLNDTCNAADEPPKQETFPCRADAETASSADDNEVMVTDNNDAVYTNNNNNATCQDDAESPLCEDHQLDHRNNPDNLQLDHRNNNNPVLDMIPWPDYVLMDGLDLICETTGVYPAFDFSEEAMDRDSEHYLSDDSSEFLLTLQQPPCTNLQAELSTERSPVESLPSSDSTDTDECQGQAEQALWSSMDLAPLCMVA